MKDEATLAAPSLDENIIVPVELRPADWTPIRDEWGNPLLDEQGNPLLEE